MQTKLQQKTIGFNKNTKIQTNLLNKEQKPRQKNDQRLLNSELLSFNNIDPIMERDTYSVGSKDNRRFS